MDKYSKYSKYSGYLKQGEKYGEKFKDKISQGIEKKYPSSGFHLPGSDNPSSPYPPNPNNNPGQYPYHPPPFNPNAPNPSGHAPLYPPNPSNPYAPGPLPSGSYVPPSYVPGPQNPDQYAPSPYAPGPFHPGANAPGQYQPGMAPPSGYPAPFGQQYPGNQVDGRHITNSWNAHAPVPSGEFENQRQICLSQGKLFEDADFQPEAALLSSKEFGKVKWKRPREITSSPHFFIGGASRFDVKQGKLGDCWLLAALANLTLHPQLLDNVVPKDQEFDERYAGIFHFRFWQFGNWTDIIVDDRLPTEKGELIFLHSAQKNEFWSALLEKAYAKLNGSYDALIGGRSCVAMDDFTGGVSEVFVLKQAPRNLFEIMIKGFERGSLMAGSIEGSTKIREERLSNGLVKGHAYSITNVKFIDLKKTIFGEKNVRLIRLRNPWGNETEWNGAWSDRSREWKMVSKEERKIMGITFDRDGEFWMNYEDFVREFDELEMTNLNLERMEEVDLMGKVKHKWSVQVFEGRWRAGSTAGGCSNYKQTFHQNPKFNITLTTEDDGDCDGQCTLIVALLQKVTNQRRGAKKSLLTIGFSLFKVNPQGHAGFMSLFFKTSPEIKGLPSYINRKQVSHRFNLAPGSYYIVPTSFEPNQEADFMLRIFTEKKNSVSEVDENFSYSGPEEKLIHQPEESATMDCSNAFYSIAGSDGEADWKALKTLFATHFNAEFDPSSCRSLVAIMDSDQSGRLSFFEFVQLWSTLNTWKNAFVEHDTDRSGSLDGHEFRSALRSAGFDVTNKMFGSLFTIYANENQSVDFANYVMCTVRMGKAMNIFAAKDESRSRLANFSLEEYMENSLCM